MTNPEIDAYIGRSDRCPEYSRYISGAKQAKTRRARVDRYAEKILNGKGLRDL